MVPALSPTFHEWQWIFAAYAVVALVGLFLVGLATEGMAGLLERAVIRKGGALRPLYVKATSPPSDWGTGQIWIWKSRQAAGEFARRRLRILVCRNTWFLTALLTVAGVVGMFVIRGPAWFSHALILALSGSLVTALFVWLWVSANEGWHRAVRDASSIGAP